ncbi:MAG: 23S rRNA (uracil(1939)-C(5))-methyltransferase RlmD [Firmicutes bacterium]|nr:23S rRNA (uracil(1939)-C(5))-methyltransferase RlmD [Bacillota bacterium]
MKKGDIIEVVVESQKFPKEGIAHYEGRRMKVDDALEGQTVNVKVLKCNDKKIKVKNVGVVERAAYETAPKCSFSEFCGGCTFPTLPYEMQVELKGKEVLAQLENNGINTDVFVGIEGCSRITEYRNKMEYTFGDCEKGGKPELGMHRKGRHMDIITVSDCVIADSDFNNITKAVLEFFSEEGIPHYHKKEKTGFQRNLIIRKGEKNSEILVNLVTTTQYTLNDEKFVDKLLGLDLKNKIVGITHTCNDNIADFVYCESIRTLWGQDHYIEEILGLKFKVTPFSFFQTNTEAAERLYSYATGMIEGVEDKTVFDLYCGTGTITQLMALKAKKVVGIEIVEEAVEAAVENARINGLDNCEFIAGDVFEALDQVKAKPDVIVLDPPRAGILPKALRKILDYKVDTMVYVSCNPLTMAQNLAVMQEEGYEIKSVKAYDNFPGTKHIECVCRLERRMPEV